MRDHWWWRPGWHVGRRAYTFHITFDDEAAVEGLDELHRLATDYQRVLAPLPGLDMVPLQWLHLTMQNVGFTDEVSESEAAAVLDEARRRCATLQDVRSCRFCRRRPRCLPRVGRPRAHPPLGDGGLIGVQRRDR